MVTGTSDWRDYTFEAEVSIHLAESAGVIARYQGLRRFLALTLSRNGLTLTDQFHGENTLAQEPMEWERGPSHILGLRCRGDSVTAYVNGEAAMTANQVRLRHGGVGYLIENGLAGFRSASVCPDLLAPGKGSDCA